MKRRNNSKVAAKAFSNYEDWRRAFLPTDSDNDVLSEGQNDQPIAIGRRIADSSLQRFATLSKGFVR